VVYLDGPRECGLMFLSGNWNMQASGPSIKHASG